MAFGQRRAAAGEKWMRKLEREMKAGRDLFEALPDIKGEESWEGADRPYHDELMRGTEVMRSHRLQQDAIGPSPDGLKLGDGGIDSTHSSPLPIELRSKSTVSFSQLYGSPTLNYRPDYCTRTLGFRLCCHPMGVNMIYGCIHKRVKLASVHRKVHQLSKSDAYCLFEFSEKQDHDDFELETRIALSP